ncbi:hypothetical protein D3C76_1718200 [compost metagenome]
MGGFQDIGDLLRHPVHALHQLLGGLAGFQRGLDEQAEGAAGSGDEFLEVHAVVVRLLVAVAFDQGVGVGALLVYARGQALEAVAELPDGVLQ